MGPSRVKKGEYISVLDSVRVLSSRVSHGRATCGVGGELGAGTDGVVSPQGSGAAGRVTAVTDPHRPGARGCGGQHSGGQNTHIDRY